MTDKNNGSLSTVLKDVDSDHRGSLPVQVVANESSISIFPQGYGDFGSAEGHGCPIFLELSSGQASTRRLRRHQPGRSAAHHRPRRGDGESHFEKTPNCLTGRNKPDAQVRD